MTALLLLAAALIQGLDEERSIQVGELKRTYLLHKPAGIDRDKPMPLVFVFHGGGGNRAVMTRLGFSRLADREKFVVLYPDAVESNWKDGRDVPQFRDKHKGVDDLKFVAAMIDEVSKELPIDPKRIYSTGASNGGIFSHYLALQMADRFAAVAPVIGGIAEPEAARFKPADRVSILMINGTEDKLVPFEGGNVAYNRGRIIPTREAAKKWVEHDGCGAGPAKEDLPDKDPNDGCTVTREVWSGGEGGTEVVLVTIRGGGHNWPGSSRGGTGTVCRDFDAVAMIWEFFKAHPKP